MPEGLPTTLRVPRIGALAIAAAALALATRTTLTSLGWVGRVFPGFMVLDNRVIPAVGLADWPATAVSGLYRSQVLAIGGEAVGSAAELYARVAALPPGTPVRYRVRRAGSEREVTVPTRRFSARDWCLLYGAFLLNGAVTLACGLIPWLLRPRAPLARAVLAFCTACALFLLTAMDVYGPGTLFRLLVAAGAALPAAGLQLALLFPQPHRHARWRFAGYGLSLLILVPFELFLYQPGAYSALFTTNMVYLGGVALFFGARLVSAYWRGRSQLARQRVRVITLGTLFGFALPVFLLLSALVAGVVSVNLAAMTPFLFALSLAYAVVKQDLFEIDAMVKRGAYYVLLTGTVGAAYVGAVVGLNLILRAGAVTDSPAFPVFFTLAVLLFFNPLRARLQAFVDRVFSRTRYDGAQVLAGAGEQLAGTLRRERIAALVCECVDATIPNGRTRLLVGDAVPPPLAWPLAEGRVVTAFDAPELYPDATAHGDVRAALAALEAEIAVPLRLRDELVGVLVAGPKRSGLFYSAGDAEFLRALAHQAAIALANAGSYEALAALNARLEERVRDRTALLESANRELAEAYTELKNAEVQLVQSEKMASLGRLVAGVAHEINNPVSFIAANVAPLRRRLAEAAEGAGPELTSLVREAEDIVQVMARGAERTAAIVKDLRSFSRLQEATRKRADLHEGVEVSLRLLEPRWRGRITLHRDYGELPLVECDPGQMNQVFMNVLANACEAITGTGNIWVSTRPEGDTVSVTIRDDGPGIAPEAVGHIFDPFFSTKDVGRGTGLGLAISHGVVAAHGGRIEVETVPGAGASFRIVLPVALAASLDRAASGGE